MIKLLELRLKLWIIRRHCERQVASPPPRLDPGIEPAHKGNPSTSMDHSRLWQTFRSTNTVTHQRNNCLAGVGLGLSAIQWSESVGRGERRIFIFGFRFRVWLAGPDR